MGRYVYAVGGNEETTRASGIRITRIKLAACAIFGVLAGIIQASGINTGQPNAGISYELDAIY